VETTAPALPAGLSLTLTAVVSCAHYLRDRAKPAPARVLASHERGGQATSAISAEGRAAMRAAGINNLKKAREAKAQKAAAG
jgi:hypothetical protein